MSDLLILNGYGIKINVSDGNLFIKNGIPLTADDKKRMFPIKAWAEKDNIYLAIWSNWLCIP